MYKQITLPANTTQNRLVNKAASVFTVAAFCLMYIQHFRCIDNFACLTWRS